jgi:hypothetical protein
MGGDFLSSGYWLDHPESDVSTFSYEVAVVVAIVLPVKNIVSKRSLRDDQVTHIYKTGWP